MPTLQEILQEISGSSSAKIKEVFIMVDRMSVESIPTKLNFTQAQEWVPVLPPTDLIFDDGEPLESNRHRNGINVLIRSLDRFWHQRNDFYCGGNMFIYYSSEQAKNRDFRGPDFFAVLDVDRRKERLAWVIWEEDGRYPDVIIELMSPSTTKVDLNPKKYLYERVFRTRNYFVYDPFAPESLQGWELDSSQHYQDLQPNPDGRLWCESLGLWVGIWEGIIDRETAPWLRFFDPQANLVLLPEEVAQQQAELAQQQAELARQRAELAQQQAELAQQRAERLAARLRELGEDLI
jgi:Uma2 family endonuclease